MTTQNKQMAAQSAAFQKQMTQMAAQQQANLTKQFAVQRQQNLSSQLQAQTQSRIQGAQQAQQGLTAGGVGVTSSDPATALGQQWKTALEDLHAKALRQVGVGV